ncbi:MAG: SEC-C domain-containing protein [Myxococcales bacterium]|nr:SEC-C domain-containing protein [Myxococcales bacterium]
MVGRNDPCPCGSGKKYKRCCFKTDQTDQRASSEKRDVATVLKPDASIYKVWLEWRNARKQADFPFMYRLLSEGETLRSAFADERAFVEACAEGSSAPVPRGEPAAFVHLRIVEGEHAELLQSIGADDAALQQFEVEKIAFTKREEGWRIDGYQAKVVPRGTKVTLSLFEQAAA